LGVNHQLTGNFSNGFVVLNDAGKKRFAYWEKEGI
jgi:hypothetical protein